MCHDRSSFLGDLETTSTSLRISYSLRVSIPSSEAEYPLARGFVAAVRRSDVVDGTEKLTATCSTCFNPNLPSIKHGASNESSCAIYFRQGKYSFRDDWCRYIIYVWFAISIAINICHLTCADRVFFILTAQVWLYFRQPLRSRESKRTQVLVRIGTAYQTTNWQFRIGCLYLVNAQMMKFCTWRHWYCSTG
jgi:hypothetical protein